MKPNLTISFRSAALLRWKSVHPLDLPFRFILLGVGRNEKLERIYSNHSELVPNTSAGTIASRKMYTQTLFSRDNFQTTSTNEETLNLVLVPPEVDGVHQRMDPTLSKTLSGNSRAFGVFVRVCAVLTRSILSASDQAHSPLMVKLCKQHEVWRFLMSVCQRCQQSEARSLYDEEWVNKNHCRAKLFLLDHKLSCCTCVFKVGRSCGSRAEHSVIMTSHEKSGEVICTAATTARADHL